MPHAETCRSNQQSRLVVSGLIWTRIHFRAGQDLFQPAATSNDEFWHSGAHTKVFCSHMAMSTLLLQHVLMDGISTERIWPDLVIDARGLADRGGGSGQ